MLLHKHILLREHILHGLLRKMSILARCIENVYDLYAPDRQHSIP